MEPGSRSERATRADALRNVAVILQAATDCLSEDPHASMSRIAEVAGVGRVTLYGHFSSRADLVDAVFKRVITDTAAVLSAVDTGGTPTDALERLIRASWQIVHRYRAVLAAGESELPAERIRGHHDKHLRRLAGLIRAGQRLGEFRSDLDAAWLVTVAYSLMHAAAAETQSGRMTSARAEQAVVATILGALRPMADGAR